MKKIVLTTVLLALFLNSNAQKINKLWEIENLEAPESVVHYKGHYYVSNVSGQPAEKNKQGFISKIDEQGKLITLKWLSGFNAPKGLGIYKNKLYVADIDSLAVVNLDSGSIDKWYHAEGATFLNDVEISTDGTVYVTDTFGGNAIYILKNDTLSILFKDARLDYPNGLKLKGNKLYIASWGVVTNSETFETEIPGSLLVMDLTEKSVSTISKNIGNLDGLVNFKEGFITSDWIAGKLMFINQNGEAQDLIDLNAGSADIEFMADKNLLLVPQMLDGKLVAYELK